MANTAIQIDNRLTGLAIAYANQPTDYIAARVAQRFPVRQRMGQYRKLKAGSLYQKTDTKVAYGARPNEVSVRGTLVDFTRDTHAVDGVVDHEENKDVIADGGAMNDLLYSEMSAALNAIRITNEEAVRDAVYTDAHYDSGLITTLSSSECFDASGSDVIKTILDAIEGCLIAPNIAVCGYKTWIALCKHSQIVEAIKNTGAREGIVTTQAVANMFGLEEIVVGMAHEGVDADDDTPSARIWDSADNFALLRRGTPMSLRAPQAAASFLQITEKQGLEVRRFFDPKRGVDGSEVVRVSDKYTVINLSTVSGHLVKNTLA